MNHKCEDFDSSEFGKRILEEMRQENEQVNPGWPDFIGCGSNVCALDRPAPGKANGKGVCECFGGLLPIKRIMIMKYIRREQAKIDALRAEVERLRNMEPAARDVVKFAEAYTGAQDAREREAAWATLWDKMRALGASLNQHGQPRTPPCKP